MKRAPTLAVVSLIIVTVVGGTIALTSASNSPEVEFHEFTDDYAVEYDGQTVGVFDDEADAKDMAERIKLDDPTATVMYTHRTIHRAELDHDGSVPVVPTTGPPTTGPSPTQPPATQPPATQPPATQPSATTVPPITTAPPATLPPGPTTQPPTTPPPTSPPTTTAPTTTAAPPSNGDLVWGYDETRPQSGWTGVALGESYVDPAYHTTVRRMTSADGTRFNRNTYSRRQTENADGTWFMSYHGDARYHVYDRATLALVRDLDIHPDAEPQWHPTDPDIVRYIAGPNSYVGDLRLYEMNVSTGDQRVIADLTDRIQATLPNALYMYDRAEGSPSADGNRYAWLVYDADEDIIGVVTYDLATDTILGITGDMRTTSPLDWVSVSPSGNKVLGGFWEGTYSYDLDFTNEVRLSDSGEHSDIAIGADGRDVYVHIDFSAGQNGGWLLATDLETAEHTRIFNLYDAANTSIHISGKGYHKPGWVIASTYSCKMPGNHAWSCHKVMAVELAPMGRVLNLAHTYNCGDNYWAETHASVNRDFTRVYFNTDTGSCGIDAEIMEITLPPFE